MDRDDVHREPLSNGIALVVLLAALSVGAAGQEPGRIRVEVRAGADAVAGATVVVAGTPQVTDAAGVALVRAPAGVVQVTVAHEGFVPVTVPVTLAGGAERGVRVELVPELTIEEEVTVVASTRTGRRIEDQPLRVEALNREEIEEKMLMTPGDIVMMLNEMGGMRVQATSPSLGAASVRIQGMRGRYTRVLSDGLPLYGSQPGGLGLLQIPPMDLGQVEVIKGVASALHGAGAMGGVVNLLSRRPGDEPEREILFNRSTRGATDGVMWLSTPLSDTWGMTLVGGGHQQDLTDVDGDGWADMAHYGRGIVRPRFFWDDGEGRSLFLTAGATRETRTGGLVPGRVLPGAGTFYREALATRRHDLGALWQTLAGRSVVTARAALARQWHEHLFGETLERDRHDTSFAELAVRRTAGRHTWVAGAAVEQDAYHPTDVPRFGHSFTTPGLFVQDDVDVALVAGGLDERTAGPPQRVRLVLQPARVRAPAVERLVDPPVGGDRVLRADAAHRRDRSGRPEPARGGRPAPGGTRPQRLDGPHPHARPGRLHRHRFRVAHRGSGTRRPLDLRVAQPRSSDHQRRRRAPGHAPAAAVRLDGQPIPTCGRRERVGGVTSDVAQTPRHSLGLVAMAENEDGRIGFELYYTGRQRLDANPYRDISAPYTLVGVLIERRVGPLRLFVNLENLTDVRQPPVGPGPASRARPRTGAGR